MLESRGSAVENILGVIKINYLREFIIGNIGITCLVRKSAGFCIREERQNLKELAERGDVYAQYKLAVYYDGKSILYFEEALQWYKRSAEQDYAPAQYNLAHMYYKGRMGVQKDFEKAFQWMQRSAEQGYVQSQYNLAVMYYKGRGTEKDLNQAFYWMEKAVRQGFDDAQGALPLIKRRRTIKNLMENSQLFFTAFFTAMTHKNSQKISWFHNCFKNFSSSASIFKVFVSAFEILLEDFTSIAVWSSITKSTSCPYLDCQYCKSLSFLK